MSKMLMPSRWGMKLVDLLVFLLVFALIVKVGWPTSALAEGIHVGGHWLGIGVQWIAGLLAQFLNWV